MRIVSLNWLLAKEFGRCVGAKLSEKEPGWWWDIHKQGGYLSVDHYHYFRRHPGHGFGITQPYFNNEDPVAQWEQISSRAAVERVNVRPVSDSWWFPGRTIMLVWWKDGPCPFESYTPDERFIKVQRRRWAPRDVPIEGAETREKGNWI